MTHEVKAYLTIGDSDARHLFCATFEDEEWDALLRFVEYVKELQAIELMREGGPGKLNIRWTEETGFSYSAELPAEDKILALLHRLRPFVLNDEQTNFHRVCNHIARRIEDENLRHFIKSIRAIYSGKRMQSMIIIKSNETLINSEETLMKWLNAHEYHKDRNKQAELESLHQILPLETSRAIFLMMLYDKARAIFIIANMINVMAGEQESVKIKL